MSYILHIYVCSCPSFVCYSTSSSQKCSEVALSSSEKSISVLSFSTPIVSCFLYFHDQKVYMFIWYFCNSGSKGQNRSAEAKSDFCGSIPCKTFNVSCWLLLFGHHLKCWWYWEILGWEGQQILGNTGVGGEIQQKSSKASHSTRLMEQEETNWKKDLFFQEVSPKYWIPTCWATKYVKSRVSESVSQHWLEQPFHFGTSLASWSCLYAWFLYWWHQAGCQTLLLQQSIMIMNSNVQYFILHDYYDPLSV